MILVAGGTGRLGTLVTSRLSARGLDVRVLTRDAARADHLRGVAADIVEGDVRVPDDVDAAVRGVTTVVSAVQGFDGPGRVTPESVDRAGNVHLIDAAGAAGADVVLMSTVGASADSRLELFRAKHAAEEHLRASSVSWTIVRATAFVELWAEIMEKPLVFGRGDNPINFVSVNDVAAVVERAVVDPGLRGHVLEVGGPDNVTFNELAVILQQSRGVDGSLRHIPRWLLHTMAPVSRRARAAIAMDTVDLTFTPSTGYPATDIRTALSANTDVST
jgi:NADH dehydrogenase